MPNFSGTSKQRLGTCQPDLQRLFKAVIKHYDCTILCGFRNQEDQQKAFTEKHSTVQFPNSKHNSFPSIAVDVAPYPIDWDDMERFRHFAGFVEGMATAMGIKIRSGGDWDRDHQFDDQRFIDMPHFELVD